MDRPRWRGRSSLSGHVQVAKVLNPLLPILDRQKTRFHVAFDRFCQLHSSALAGLASDGTVLEPACDRSARHVQVQGDLPDGEVCFDAQLCQFGTNRGGRAGLDAINGLQRITTRHGHSSSSSSLAHFERTESSFSFFTSSATGLTGSGLRTTRLGSSSTSSTAWAIAFTFAGAGRMFSV